MDSLSAAMPGRPSREPIAYDGRRGAIVQRIAYLRDVWRDGRQCASGDHGSRSSLYFRDARRLDSLLGATVSELRIRPSLP